MDYNNKQLKDILRWGRMGIIACRIAEVTGMTPLEALKDFFRSKTCAYFHDRRTGLDLYGEYYIADEFMLERGYITMAQACGAHNAG